MSNDPKFTTIDMSKLTKVTRHSLKTDRIKTLDDVKRVLEFLDIEAVVDEYTQPRGYENVKDLFE